MPIKYVILYIIVILQRHKTRGYLSAMALNKQTFEDRLDESRIVVVLGYLNSESASKIIFKLLTLSTIDEKEEIQLFISSSGGSYLDMMAICDTLNTIPNPVTGICIGAVHGFATLLLAKCTKGRRFALKHSEINFSQPYGYLAPGANQQTEIAIEAREARIKREAFEIEMAKATGQTLDKIHADCEVGVTLTAEESKDYGIIDEIL